MQAKMGLGINMGNRIDLAGSLPRAVNEAYFEAYATQGFTNVRIPVCWDGHTNKTAPYTVDPVFLDQVFQYVQWSTSRNMVTVLNTHHEDWLDTAGANFDAELPRLVAIWQQVCDCRHCVNESQSNLPPPPHTPGRSPPSSPASTRRCSSRSSTSRTPCRRQTSTR
jgi:hypothetical protein